MRMLKSILLATDFRPASQAAAQAAVRLAAAFGSRVTLLHVMEPLPNWPAHRQEPEKEVALHVLAAQLAGQQVEVAGMSLAVGPAAHTILDRARELDADLILMGAGDRTGLFQFSGGPTAVTVIEHAPQPVLAVRPGQPDLAFRKILCPVDQSGPSAQGLSNAVRLAQALGGELVVLTVVPEVSWLTAAAETGQLADARAEYDAKWREEFDRFVAGIPAHGVATRTEVRYGSPHEQILAAARDHQADVIVMGATGRTGLVRVLLGSTTRRVLERLPCSLLTVKEEDVLEELFEGELQLIQQLMVDGRTALAAGAPDAAVGRFRQALAHNPFHVAATRGLAEAYERLDRPDLAGYYRHRAEKLEQA